MSSSPLVLITGGNGFVGYAVLAGTLKAGYRVRAAVRRQDAVDSISRGPSIQDYLSSGALSFAIVTDNSKPGAYLEAARDSSFIIHVASPLATAPGDLVQQAVAGNKAILEAAEATPSVERVVFTSSTSSIRPFDRMLPEHPANQAIISGNADSIPALTADTKVPTQPPISIDAPGFHKYINAKIAATNLVHGYGAERLDEVHFSIVNLMPGWILGPEELARNKQEAFKGSNLMLGWLFMELSLAPLMGFSESEAPPLLSETVHLDDVVESHVNALNVSRVQGKYRNFLLCSDAPTGPVIMDAVDIVKRELPDEVANGKIPFAGKLGTLESKFDTAPAEEELLRHPFQPYANQVKDTIKWYVHLEDREGV
ncbi:hypothetical protein ACLMJK_006163 [Lecanora helva]